MLVRICAARGIVYRARRQSLNVINKLICVVYRYFGGTHHNERDICKHCDHVEIFNRIISGFCTNIWIPSVVADVECDECMAVGWRLSYRHCSDCTTSPRAIVYDDRLAESLGHGFRKNTRLNIQAATRGDSEDPSKRFGWKALPT